MVEGMDSLDLGWGGGIGRITSLGAWDFDHMQGIFGVFTIFSIFRGTGRGILAYLPPQW